MSGSGIPNSDLLSSIQRLKEATQKLPLSTPEGTADGVVYRIFCTKPSEIEGSIFEKIDQAYTRCFSQNPSSEFTPLDNVLRGRFGMNVVIRFFEGCALSPKMGLLKVASGGISTGSLGSQELRDYFDGRYQYNGGDILVWWKENKDHFPILSRIARDFLAIPATRVSVERLFSRCKLVMSDYRNMSVETARRIITCQQWLEVGLGTDLPDFLSGDSN